jgi:transcriptional regulator with GAF, ATPase, and Fis domain
MHTLMKYDFPGNIRELRNLVERACILSTADEITSEHFPVAVKAREGRNPIDTAKRITPSEVVQMLPETLDLREFLTSLEKALIQRALDATNGAQAEAARRLGLSRSDVSYKLGKHNIERH